jgi:hypothetical protein
LHYVNRDSGSLAGVQAVEYVGFDTIKET